MSKRLYVLARPAGGAPCAPSASSDAGTTGYFDYEFSGDGIYGSTVNGDFARRRTGVWQVPGSFMFCIWLADSESAPTTPFTQIVTFRRPTGTISATVAPLSPLVGQTATVAISGSSEAPKYVYATVRQAGGAPCGPSFGSESGSSLVSGRSVNGAFGLTAPMTLHAPGAYLICLWLADSGSDAAPVAGPQPATFSVLQPCVVPAIPRFTALPAYRASLAAAGCTAGAQRYTASVTYPRGTVVKATPAPGATLAPGAAVDLVISRGRRCRVPAARRGMGLSTARARLRAANCVPGSVRYVRSSRRRGTVVRFTPRSGRSLSPRALVGIRLSRGRGR